MASLVDLLAPPSSAPPAFSLASNAVQSSNTIEDAGVGQHRLLRDFSQFQLPDVVNGQAARGAFFSGATGNKADRLRTGVSDQFGDIERLKARALAGQTTNSLLALTGMSI